jgi:hypothetical protein
VRAGEFRNERLQRITSECKGNPIADVSLRRSKPCQLAVFAAMVRRA